MYRNRRLLKGIQMPWKNYGTSIFEISFSHWLALRTATKKANDILKIWSEKILARHKVDFSFHLIFFSNHQLQNFWSTYSGRFHAFCKVWELENPAFCEINSCLVGWLVETGWDILGQNLKSAPTRAILFLLLDKLCKLEVHSLL